MIIDRELRKAETYKESFKEATEDFGNVFQLLKTEQPKMKMSRRN